MNELSSPQPPSILFLTLISKELKALYWLFLPFYVPFKKLPVFLDTASKTLQERKTRSVPVSLFTTDMLYVSSMWEGGRCLYHRGVLSTLAQDWCQNICWGKTISCSTEPRGFPTAYCTTQVRDSWSSHRDPAQTVIARCMTTICLCHFSDGRKSRVPSWPHSLRFTCKLLCTTCKEMNSTPCPTLAGHHKRGEQV